MDFGASAQFPATAWTVVRAAKDRHSPEGVEALNRCIAGYWRPVFYFVRAKGYSVHEAENLTQEFFSQFFERDWIRRADPHRGRFRTFLLAVLSKFLADQKQPRAPRQQTFDDRMVCISALLGEEERRFEPPAHQTAEEVFMREWAHAVISNVARRLELWCQCRGRPDWYQMFRQVCLPPPGAARATQQSLAEQLQCTRDQVRYGLEEVNGQFIELLRAEVADQVGPEDDLDTEIRELDSLLGG